MAIYARENGAGTVFTTEEEMAKNTESTPSQPQGPASLDETETPDNSDAPVPPKKGKPTLKIIK